MKKENIIRSEHPYAPYIPKNATKLIVGTIPPYRFCHNGQLLKKNDVRFYYGANKNHFWKLIEEISHKKFTFENTESAIEERKYFLKERRIGITDIVQSCIHKDKKSDDRSLKKIQPKKLDKLLQEYPNIDTLICTSTYVKQLLNTFFANRKYLAEQADPRTGTMVINDKEYNVIILYSPSPYALVGMGIGGKEKRKRQYEIVFTDNFR